MKATLLVLLLAGWLPDLHGFLFLVIGLVVGAIIFPVLYQVAGAPIMKSFTWFRNITQGYWTVVTMASGFIIMLADAMGGINLDAFLGDKAGAKVGAAISLAGVFLRYITTTPIGWAKSAVEDVTGMNPAKPGTPAATPTNPNPTPAPAPAPVADPVLTPIQQEILNLQNQIKTAATKGDTATVNSLTAALNALQTANAPPPAVAPVAPVTPVATP